MVGGVSRRFELGINHFVLNGFGSYYMLNLASQNGLNLICYILSTVFVWFLMIVMLMDEGLFLPLEMN